MKVTIDLDPDLYRAVKVEAARADRSVREIVDEFPDVDAFVFGPAEMGSLHRRLEQLERAQRRYGTKRATLVAGIEALTVVTVEDAS